MRIDNFLSHFAGVKSVGANKWRCLCPAHDDKKPSLQIRVAGSKILIHCLAGCRTEHVLAAAGLSMRDLFLDDDGGRKAGSVVATYDYVDEQGNILYQVRRKEPKDFVCRRPDGNGSWIYDMEATRRVLYRLPRIVSASPGSTVYFVEGEKDADRLAKLGLAATTAVGGAAERNGEPLESLADRTVVIIPDNDEPGRQHARWIEKSLQGIARAARVVELPGLPPKGDVSDWLDSGHTLGDLIALTEQEGKQSAPVSDGKAQLTSLDECMTVVNRWLLLPDDSIVRYLLALVIANRLPGDPVWGLVIAPSGGAKTELLNSLGGIPEIYPLSDLTPQTFVSGYKNDKNASLLKKLQPGTILTLKDFTTVLSMHRDARQAILSQLREIADGSYRKSFGTGDSVVWEGKIGLIAGVTTVIDQHQSVYSLLGERFLQMRLVLPGRKALARAARRTVGKEAEMRHELKTGVASFIAGIDVDRFPTWPEELTDALDSLATLVAFARSGTVRDSHSKELQFIPQPEIPTRLVKQLYKLGQALAMLRGADTVGAEDYAIVQKIATDTISDTRWRILSYLLEQETDATTSEVATSVGLPTSTAKRHLDDLVGLTLAEGDKKGSGVATKWRVSTRCTDLIEESLTSPHISPHEGKREVEEQGVSVVSTSVERSTEASAGAGSQLRHSSSVDKPVPPAGDESPAADEGETSTPTLTATAIAETRTAAHPFSSTTRALSEDYDVVGAAGEVAFARAFGLNVDEEGRPEGDGGVDFALANGTTVDVKTYRKPWNLLREVGTEEAEVLVLAAYDCTAQEAELIGWEWDYEMLNCPTRDFGHGIINHYKAAGELRAIQELHKLAAATEDEVGRVPF